MHRRKFFGQIVAAVTGSALVAAPTIAATSAERTIVIGQPTCPKCFCVFDLTPYFQQAREAKTAQERDSIFLTPHPIRCPYCEWTGEIVPARRS